jgi:ATP-dependent exoDNAse (exonuclease V) alpha subunit
MMERGGFDALSDDHKASAERSYEVWRTEKNPEAGARHDLRDYVAYVQRKWAEENQQPDREAHGVRRFTTQAILDAEQQVVVAVHDLAANMRHGVSDRTREKVAGGKTMTDEQAAAFIHATLPGGFAMIDGQAGTGKSYTIAAVREAYEKEGRTVIGLAPTNAVAEDMRADGFSHAATIHSEIFALNNGRRHWDARTVVIVDEAAMLDTKLIVAARNDDRPDAQSRAVSGAD